jgi:hypothetical protein
MLGTTNKHQRGNKYSQVVINEQQSDSKYMQVSS